METEDARSRKDYCRVLQPRASIIASPAPPAAAASNTRFLLPHQLQILLRLPPVVGNVQEYRGKHSGWQSSLAWLEAKRCKQLESKRPLRNRNYKMSHLAYQSWPGLTIHKTPPRLLRLPSVVGNVEEYRCIKQWTAASRS
ncbi:hypothetical protein Bbelb_338950 [Branchiostoma belcheri]|nr:hypothetical protein Bbelb_338950 [Branchiostoma belcheri]